MAKASEAEKPHANDDPRQSEYYCEYVCQDEYWWLVNSSTPSGYYCPNINTREPWGCGTCTDDRENETCNSVEPVYGGSFAPERSNEYYCEYEFRRLGNGGTFLNVYGKCQDYSSTKGEHDYREYCPVDLLEFLKEHGFGKFAALSTALAEAGEIGLILRIRIDPRSIHACCRDTPAHGPH